MRGRGGGGPGRATQLWGLRVFILSFLFSLCLLQDLKGQPRPRRRARRPRFLRSPDALCGPAGPAHTGALVRNCRVFLGTHLARGSWAAELGSVAWCKNFYRVRLGWEIKLLDNCFPTQKQRGVRGFSIAPGISSSAPKHLADTIECRFAAPQSAQISECKPVL